MRDLLAPSERKTVEIFAMLCYYKNGQQTDKFQLTEVLGMKELTSVGLSIMLLLSLGACSSHRSGDYPAAIMVNGTSYYSTNKAVPVEVDESAIKYTVSYADDGVPKKDGETNFNRETGNPYAVLEDGMVVVLIDNEWIEFKADNANEIQQEGTPTDEAFDIVVACAARADYSKIASGALNTEMMKYSSVLHLPIYKFDTLDEFDQFKTSFGESLGIDQKHDEDLSFNEAAAVYDEAFFDKNSLILVYIGADAGTCKFGVSSIFCDGNTFCIHVERLSEFEAAADDAGSRLIMVAVPDSMLKECTSFDADLDNDLS